MFLSIYTFVKDGLFLDYHVVAMLKHHLPLADEIIVNEGYSSDNTFEIISNIDSKIKIFRSHWGQPKDINWLSKFKDDARQKCVGEWCILLDCDEFIPEWEFDSLRQYLKETTDIMVPVKMINFYGNYKVYNSRPEKLNWPFRKMIIHRNMPGIEVWGDGANVRLKDKRLDWGHSSREFSCHHFGFVRYPARLRQKWRNIFGRMYKKNWINWLKLPSFLFNMHPHDWMDPQFLGDLAIYEGPYIRAVRENPSEFVRDGFSLYRFLMRETKVS
jgi:hypothetical protein